MGMEKFDMYAQLYESKLRYKRACDQLLLLNEKLDALNNRYRTAKTENHRSFRYHLRMRIIVVEGMLDAYTNYACLKKNEILDLNFKLFGEDPSDGERLFDGVSADDTTEADDEENDTADDEQEQ